MLNIIVVPAIKSSWLNNSLYIAENKSKMKDKRIKFIKEAHSAACSDWKKRIEAEYPKLFKPEGLEVGKWYKFIGRLEGERSTPPLVNYQGGKTAYGVNAYGEWEIVGFGTWTFESSPQDWKPATDSEVEAALIAEAKKRGFKEGVMYKTPTVCVKAAGKLKTGWTGHDDLFYSDSDGFIFQNGQWATIVETITKADAEKELGKQIID